MSDAPPPTGRPPEDDPREQAGEQPGEPAGGQPPEGAGQPGGQPPEGAGQPGVQPTEGAGHHWPLQGLPPAGAPWQPGQPPPQGPWLGPPTGQPPPGQLGPTTGPYPPHGLHGDQAPPPGGPGWQPPPYPAPAPPRQNGWALAALIVGLVSLLIGLIPFGIVVAGPGGIAAIVLGIVGLGRGRRLGRGKGMAVTGLVTGVLAVVAGIVWIAFIFTTGVFDDVETVLEREFTTGTSANVFDLRVGECFNEPGGPDGDLVDVEVVPCSESHDNEVFAAVLHPGGAAEPYPPEAALAAFGRDTCEGDEFEDYVGVPYLQSRYYADSIYPAEATWGGGERTVLCILFDTEPKIGSARGTAD